MEDYKIYKSKLILENTVTEDKGFDLNNVEAVVKFAEETLKIGTYPEEVVFVICMNPTNQCINYFELSRGTLLASYIGIKELMKRVLISNAHSFLLVHNHPCGEAIPSPEDYEITTEIDKAARLLHVNFLDHVIVGQGTYASITALISQFKTNQEKEAKGEINGN